MAGVLIVLALAQVIFVAYWIRKIRTDKQTLPKKGSKGGGSINDGEDNSPNEEITNAPLEN